MLQAVHGKASIGNCNFTEMNRQYCLVAMTSAVHHNLDSDTFRDTLEMIPQILMQLAPLGSVSNLKHESETVNEVF